MIAMIDESFVPIITIVRSVNFFLGNRLDDIVSKLQEHLIKTYFTQASS